MVGPTPERDRRLATRRLAAGFVGFVGLSSLLTALYSGATPIEAGVVAVAGLGVGVALLVAIGVRP